MACRALVAHYSASGNKPAVCTYLGRAKKSAEFRLSSREAKLNQDFLNHLNP